MKDGCGGKVNILIITLLVLTLGVSTYSLIQIGGIKQLITPAKSLSIQDFLAKLTAHPELSLYKNVNPLNILLIDNTNLPVLQGQIAGLDISFIGRYLVQYKDRVIIYSLTEDKIVSNIPVQQQSQELTAAQQEANRKAIQGFLAKLIAHPELSSYKDIIPLNIILIDNTNLQALQSQIAGLDASYIGKHVIEYQDKIIIYSLADDRIVSNIPVQPQK